jgi:multiple sugar transport system substrate-binding protein
MVVLFGIAAGTAAVVVPPRLSAPGTGSSRARDTRITFTVWGMPFEDKLFRDGYARGYEQANPGVSVDYQRHSDINMKYNAWHARNYGPEVMRVMVTDYHDMVARGMLEPLNAYIASPEHGLSDADMAEFPRTLLDALKIDGKLYALPEDNAVFGLYYNKDIIDAYNAAHPGDRIAYPDATWTWDDLRSAARKLTKRDENGRAVVYGLDQTIWQWPFMNFFAQAGGVQWSKDGLTTLINTREPDGSAGAGVRALEYLRALAHEDRSWEPYFGRDQGTGPDSRFANGSVALYLDGSWMAPNFENRNPALRFAIAPAPRGRVNAVVCGSCLWGISAHARNKEAAWPMLRWLVSPPQAIRYWDTLRVAPPANVAVVNSEAFKSTRGIPREGEPGKFEVPPMPRELFADRGAWLLHAFAPDPVTGVPPGFVPTGLYQRALEDEIARMLREYLESPRGPSAQDALDRAARNVHQVIDRDRAAAGLPPVAR